MYRSFVINGKKKIKKFQSVKVTLATTLPSPRRSAGSLACPGAVRTLGTNLVLGLPLCAVRQEELRFRNQP